MENVKAQCSRSPKPYFALKRLGPDAEAPVAAPEAKPNQGIHPAVSIFLCFLELAFRIVVESLQSSCMRYISNSSHNLARSGKGRGDLVQIKPGAQIKLAFHAKNP